MRRLVIFLAGCNAVFDIKETRQYDAAFFDAPIDAPFGCPAFGAPPPAYSLVLHQETIQTCVSYYATDTLAAGNCFDAATSMYVPMVGTPHAVLPLDPSLPRTNMMTPPYQLYTDPRPSSDGTHLYIRHQHQETGYHFTIDVYTLTGGTWSFTGTLPSTTQDPALIAVMPTAAGDRVILDEGSVETEWLPDGSGGYTLAGTHPETDLGISSIQSFALARDGLHAVVEAFALGQLTPSAFWTERATLDDWFSPAKPVVGVPMLASIDLTPDCARIYFAALGSIIYIQQQ